MNSVVHVLNGDSTVPTFAKSRIPGDVIVWRELLCDGPIKNTIGSDDFWKGRYAFFESKLGISKLEYFDKTIKEIIKLEDLPKSCELVLWFEYDLLCQVNLLAACTYLLQNYRKDLTYYLVCTGKVKEQKQLQSLSDFSAEAYITLYENKVKLTKHNLLYAEQCWNVYTENNPKKLRVFDFNQCNKFNYLQDAMDQHLQRFPKEKGLNQIENKIVEIIKDSALTSNEIVGELLIWQKANTVYGFGDIQYFMYLKKLNKYYEIRDSKYYLNAIAKKL